VNLDTAATEGDTDTKEKFDQTSCPMFANPLSRVVNGSDLAFNR
jgi:hypothetical protein